MSPTQQQREDPDWVKAVIHAHIHYSVPGMNQVTVRRDLIYKTTKDGPLHFDLYTPLSETGAAPVPAVILIHGGPIPSNLLTSPKDWGLFRSYGQVLAASGLAVIMFNHRFFALDMAPAAMTDIHDLVAHISAQAEGLAIDANRICLWAFSGGGVFLSPFLRETPEAIRCVIAYYAALHASVPEFSPATRISENIGRLPPLLVARAGLDMAQLNDGIDHFVRQALQKNAPLDLLNHATGHHTFDVRDENDRTRDILRHTVEFVRTNLELR
jgi:acetyl esterase/lipase